MREFISARSMLLASAVAVSGLGVFGFATITLGAAIVGDIGHVVAVHGTCVSRIVEQREFVGAVIAGGPRRKPGHGRGGSGRVDEIEPARAAEPGSGDPRAG